jgi:hypothetical protein
MATSTYTHTRVPSHQTHSTCGLLPAPPGAVPCVRASPAVQVWAPAAAVVRTLGAQPGQRVRAQFPGHGPPAGPAGFEGRPGRSAGLDL